MGSGIGNRGEVTSDPTTGEYEITGLKPGQYVLSTHKSGYADRTEIPATVVVGGNDTVIEIVMWKEDLASQQGYARLNLPTGAIARISKGRVGPGSCAVVFSPDGKILAVATGTEICLYDAHTQEELALLTEHTREVTSIAFSPSGEILASGSEDKTVKLWSVSEKREIATLDTGWVLSVSFSPDGEVLASGSSKAVKLWSVSKRREIAMLKSRSGSGAV